MSMPLLPPNGEGFSVETREASPANFLIKIESFSLLSEYGIGKYESREFEGGDYKWKLIIYLDGLDSEKEGDSDHVCVFLAAAGTSSLPVHWEINAIFTIFLYNQISDNYLCFRGKPRRFHEMKPKWGFTKLISKEFLTDPRNGYVVDDTCVFGAEVFVTKSQRVIERLSLLNETSRNYKREWTISHLSKMGGRVGIVKISPLEITDGLTNDNVESLCSSLDKEQLKSLCDRMAESAKLVAECLISDGKINEKKSKQNGSVTLNGTIASPLSTREEVKSVPSNNKVDDTDQDSWSLVQERALVQALKTFSKDTNQRWERVAAAVPGKSVAHCKKKFTLMKESFRNKKNAV